MKYLRTAIMIIPLLMVGCLEVETTSKVNPNGSIERSIQLKGSAASISGTNFNIPRHDLDAWFSPGSTGCEPGAPGCLFC